MGDLQVRSVPTHARTIVRPPSETSHDDATTNIGVPRPIKLAFHFSRERPENSGNVFDRESSPTGVRKGGILDDVRDGQFQLRASDDVSTDRALFPQFHVSRERPDSMEEAIEWYREQTGVRKGGFGADVHDGVALLRHPATEADSDSSGVEVDGDAPQTAGPPNIRGIRKGGRIAGNYHGGHVRNWHAR